MYHNTFKFSAFLLPLGLLTLAISAVAAPDLEVKLGPVNQENGLHIPSGGDGVNVPVSVDGIAARRMTGAGAQYLYVDVQHTAYRGPLDLWVTVEAFDDTYSRITIEYDKNGPRSNVAMQHRVAEGSMWLLGEGGRRRGVFFLPQARLENGQNFGADFRLAAKNVAIGKITVSTQKPANYDFTKPFDLPSLGSLKVERHSGIDWTLGNDASAEDAAVFKQLGVTGMESYVDWAEVEPQPGQWDWSRWDRQAAILHSAGLKWVPFLIAGPAYGTPLWFQNSSQATRYRCLEHGRESAVQSLFNPALRPAVKRFLQAFAARYKNNNAPGAVLLGVTGIYGESLYPAGPEGGWTTRLTGDYHNHAGWWAGDPHAATAFRQAMRRRYTTLQALNAAWGTKHINWSAVQPFVPEAAPSDRARADFVEWYQEAMTQWVRFWAQTAREALPDTPIYLVTGGSGTPMLGADFTAQAKAVAPYKVGLRITNEHNDYAANFTLTREVVTATRHYGTYAGLEPAGNVSPIGLIARIYNAVASGARELHDYAENFTTDKQALQHLKKALPQLAPQQPQVNAALYVSRESWALDNKATEALYTLARPLRDLTDWDYVTRDTVADGALKNIRLLLLCQSPVLEPKAAQAIESWVRNGGVLIAASSPGQPVGNKLHDNMKWRASLFASVEDEGTTSEQLRQGVRKIGKGYTLLLPPVDNEKLLHALLNILQDSKKYFPDVPALSLSDNNLDMVFATQTATGTISFNQETGEIIYNSSVK